MKLRTGPFTIAAVGTFFLLAFIVVRVVNATGLPTVTLLAAPTIGGTVHVSVPMPGAPAASPNSALPAFYISPTGNDNNTGSNAATALLTPGAALTALAPSGGGTIICEPGVYSNNAYFDLSLVTSGGTRSAQLTIQNDEAVYGRSIFLCANNTFANWTYLTNNIFYCPESSIDLTNLVAMWCSSCSGQSCARYHPMIFQWNAPYGSWGSAELTPSALGPMFTTNRCDVWPLQYAPDLASLNNTNVLGTGGANWTYANGNLYVVFANRGTNTGQKVYAPSSSQNFLYNTANCSLTMRGIEAYFFDEGFFLAADNVQLTQCRAVGMFDTGFYSLPANGTPLPGAWYLNMCQGTACNNQGFAFGSDFNQTNFGPFSSVFYNTCLANDNQRHGFVDHGNIAGSYIGCFSEYNWYDGFSDYSEAEGTYIGCLAAFNSIGWNCNFNPDTASTMPEVQHIYNSVALSNLTGLFQLGDNIYQTAVNCEISSFALPATFDQAGCGVNYCYNTAGTNNTNAYFEFDGCWSRAGAATFQYGTVQNTTNQAANNANNVTVIQNPVYGGTVSGGGAFLAGSPVQISATPNPGWKFTGWSDGDSDNPRMIIVSSNAVAYAADFVTNTGTLTLVAAPLVGGTVNGGGTYPAKSQVQISAAPYGGWSFMMWNDGDTNNPRPVTVPAAGATYAADFQIQQNAPVVLAASLIPPSGVRFQFIGTPSRSYVLLAATNLSSPASWQPVVTNPTDTNGNWVFIDTNALSAPARFFRAKLQ